MSPAKDTPNPNLEALKEQRLKEILDPTKAGLIVIDLQNDFLAPDGKSDALWHQNVEPMRAVLPAIERMAGLFHSIGRPVIRTKTYEDPELRTEAGRDRFLWFEDNDREGSVACIKGTSGAEFFVAPAADDIILEKDRVSAYVNTSLNDIIRNEGIGTLFITGLKTQRCVARTLQDLYDNEPNLHVVVLEDCVASDDETLHQATMAEIKKFYPPVLTSEDLARAWSVSNAPINP